VLSSLKGDGMDEWCHWLLQKVREKKEANVAVNVE
jgi:hydrogenase nickel incorporation protein HypB